MRGIRGRAADKIRVPFGSVLLAVSSQAQLGKAVFGRILFWTSWSRGAAHVTLPAATGQRPTDLLEAFPWSLPDIVSISGAKPHQGRSMPCTIP